MRTIILASLFALTLLGQRRPIGPIELQRLRSEEPRRVRAAGEQVRASRFGLNENHSFELRSALTDHYGRLHARFRQLYKGVRVLGAGAIAHVDEQDRFLEPSARLFADIDLDVIPLIDEEAAIAAVAPNVSGRGLRFASRQQLVIVPDRVLQFTEDASKRVLPPVPALGEHQWVNKGYRLAWWIVTFADESLADDPAPAAWLVDARTGEVRRGHPLISEDTPPRTAVNNSARTTWFGAVELATSRNEETGLYELTDPTRGGNTVLNLNGASSFRRSRAKPFTSTSGAWGNGQPYSDTNSTSSGNGQTPAAEAAFAIERAWDYLLNVHGHAGLDGKGAPMEARVHFGAPGGSAALWHRFAGAAFFSSGTPTQTVTDLETVAHELGHGFWFAQLDTEGGYNSEANAVSEGNADIFASLAEFYYLGSQGRGNVLMDVEAAWNWRPRMVNPRGDLTGPPFFSYWSSDAAIQEPHAAGAIYGHLFVTLARGASRDVRSPSYSRFLPNGMVGLGVPAAAEIWYLATAGHLPEEPNFEDLRTAYLEAAAFLFGAESSGYATVLNAFAAVGLGTPVSDALVPTVSSLSIQSVDEGEASLLVSTNASDDLGVAAVEFVAGGRTLLARTRPPYSGYLDIAALAPGSYTLLARALDASGKVGLATAPFTLRGVNQLLSDGGLEGAGSLSRWSASPGVIRGGRTESFLGERHAAFSASGSMSQPVTIPETAVDAVLSFRLRIEPGNGLPIGARLELQVRDGATVNPLATYFDTPVNAETFSNGYVRQNFSLAPYRGKTVELRLIATIPNTGPDAAPVRFRADNLSVTATESLGVTAAAEVEDGETSLILRVRNLSGIRPNQISRIEYLVGGEVLAKATAEPYLVVRQSNDLARRTWQMTAAVYDLAGVKVVESAPVTFTVGEANQLLQNGGFETGPRSWVIGGQTSFPGDPDPSASTARAFLGLRYALLGGRGTPQTYELSQSLTIPAEATAASLSFRVRIDSVERGPNDTLTVRVFERAGGGDVTLLTALNSQFNTKGPESARGYVRRSFDSSRYIGREIQVQFLAREDGSAPTSFLIDAVSLTWK